MIAIEITGMILLCVICFIGGAWYADNENDEETTTEKLLDHLYYSDKISKQQYYYYIDKYTSGRKVDRIKLM